MSDDFATLVIDNGSGEIKAGLAGNDEPTTIFSTVTGSLSRNINQVSFHYLINILQNVFGFVNRKKRVTISYVQITKAESIYYMVINS